MLLVNLALLGFLSVVTPAEAVPSQIPTCVINPPEIDGDGCLLLQQTCCYYENNQMSCWIVKTTDCGPLLIIN